MWQNTWTSSQYHLDHPQGWGWEGHVHLHISGQMSHFALEDDLPSKAFGGSHCTLQAGGDTSFQGKLNCVTICILIGN